MKNKSPFVECIRNGFQIYPVYKRGSWFIRVDFKGKLHIMGTKPIHNGSILRGKEFYQTMEEAYEHIYKKHIQ